MLVCHLLSLLQAVFVPGVHADGPIVDLGYAKYQGVNTAENVTRFLGIRFAAPPTGSLRWRVPRSPDHVAGILSATAQPPSCLTSGSGLAAANPYRPNTTLATRDVPAEPSEDCLFLSVYTPKAIPSPAADLPVVVWIHGGGYVTGAEGFFTGENLIRQSGRGVVVVTIQHRLGLFGFLAGKAVKSDGVLNVGLLDQEFALRWVQEHIGKFGGNKNLVTIWGQSAGAGSVIQHMISRDGNTPPLFQAAITSSTFLPSQYRYDDVIPEKIFSQVVDKTNCTSSGNALACLRETDAKILGTANNEINSAGFYGTFVFAPVVDGDFIVRRPTESLALGRVKRIPLLSITNANEGVILVDATSAATTNATAYAMNLFPTISAAQAAEARRQYSDVGDMFTQMEMMMGEAMLICPTYYLLSAVRGRSFKGEFAIPPGYHSDDIEYYFPGSHSFPGPSPVYNNTVFITAFSQSFLSFAISLDPNVKVDANDIKPKWDTYSGKNTEMLFNRTEAGEPLVQPVTTSEAVLKRCRFWHSIGETTNQ